MLAFMGGALVLAVDVAAAPPSLLDNTADLDRLKKAFRAQCPGRPVIVPFCRAAALAAAFRLHGFQGTVVAANLPLGYELHDLLPQPPQVLPGIALDLGTTHIEASLIDLRASEGTGATDRILATGSILNAQIRHGHDILSRIHFAGRDDNLRLLYEDVVSSINELIAALCVEARVRGEDVRAMVIAGNTTMIHFLTKLNPYSLCREPYTPVANTFDPCHASDLGIGINPLAPVWILPSVGSYFGGDLIAGIVASGMDQAEGISMLIDVGTNAEVVIGNRDWLIACAGAAGPALEGGVAKMGMRAQPGAIERAAVNPASGAISWQTIGNAPPRGICGSGMVDLVAGLYLARAIDLRGKFRKQASLPWRETEDGLALTIVPAMQSADGQGRPSAGRVRDDGSPAEGEAILLSQLDLDAIMRSKAAMYAILTTLAGQVGVTFQDLERIYVAGAFGRHISPASAITLGMIPDLPLEKYEAIGNSSLAGAQRLLLDDDARRRSQEVAGRITYVELNVNQDFMIRFSGSRFIPHTDPALFPSVPRFQDN